MIGFGLSFKRFFSVSRNSFINKNTGSIKNPTIKTKNFERANSQQCVAYCISNKIDRSIISNLFTSPLKISSINSMEYIADVPNVVNIKLTNLSSQDPYTESSSENSHNSIYNSTTQLFIFLDLGVIVNWGNEGLFKIQPVISKLKQLGHDVHSQKFIDEESEIIPFSTENDISTIENGIFKLKTNYDEIDKLAFSHSLALSVKLSYYENCLENLIDKIRYLPQNIKMGNTNSYNRKDMLKMAGEIENLKLHVNLDSNFLNIDDIYWDYDDVSKQFQKCSLLSKYYK